MMRFASLGSGSKGNGTLVQSADTLVLIDCGFSAREAQRRMARLGVEPGQLDAILVTHEHSDHCSGVAVLSRKYRIPVYLTHGTASSGRVDDCFETRHFGTHDNFAVGNLEVRPVAVPHDAREPAQFVLAAAGRCLGILTDLGTITPWVRDCYAACDALVLEFNHDSDMLRQGSYPPALKRRVGGDWGHLNNGQAAGLLTQLDRLRLQHLVVAHVSESNNTAELAGAALAGVMPTLANVTWADQQQGFDWLFIDRS